MCVYCICLCNTYIHAYMHTYIRIYVHMYVSIFRGRICGSWIRVCTILNAPSCHSRARSFFFLHNLERSLVSLEGEMCLVTEISSRRCVFGALDFFVVVVFGAIGWVFRPQQCAV